MQLQLFAVDLKIDSSSEPWQPQETFISNRYALTQHAVDCNTVNSFKRFVDHYIRDKGY